MHTYVINRGSEFDERVVKAAHVVTEGQFVDFHDGSGLVLRLRAADVHSVERETS
ncbi:hypothetical protein OG873_23210 [Streptomyces violaceus]|uniref:hypothetical protein n=1 Tax=Streptomyces violaceus TaxID=1936 RepID=UPI002E2B1D0D|nr:hypothetical protein [Streptomyces violaceus]